MDIGRSTPLLGGLSARSFMHRHWQKAPLLVRQAVPASTLASAPVISRAGLFELAARSDVESRLIERDGERWKVREGPVSRRALPTLKTSGWTLLVHGVDLHVDAAHRLLSEFRFAPDARLDDVMVSYASDGDGDGPHVDTYDVYLLQLQGTRRWRIGRVDAPSLRADTPLKILDRFEATDEWLLEAGDMLYLPPGWGHDGVAAGECITCSIGFRAPRRHRLAADVLERILDLAAPDDDVLFGDPSQRATTEPARIPMRLHRFADAAIDRLVGNAQATACALGEVLSEPKPGVAFGAGASDSNPPLVHRASTKARAAQRPASQAGVADGVVLDRRSRMLYDDRHVFINGESFRATGRDAALIRRLADQRELAGRDVALLSREARALLDHWVEDGWLRLDRSPGVKD